ncbi:MAG: MmgE/PrpD family protein [Deltaproteobacteria bacterium]|nr:MmgE/PrpD family protein [Deltaproteobacteria bacterium]
MIGSGTLTKTLASYFATVNYNALDGDSLRVTKEHILYTLGTVLAGSSAPGAQEVLAGVRAFGAGQESSVLPRGEKLPAPSAALVNAAMAHSRELDINDDRIAYKSSVAAVPAALALAEKIGGVSGKDFIAAVCVGVDFGIRVGLATNPKPVHAQAIALGPLAAAVTCGKILGLDEAAMANALGIAYCRVSFTGNSTVSPSLTKRLGIGFAAQSGVLAALLASAGFPGAGELFQGKGGYYNFFFNQDGDYELILDQLGKRFEIVEVGPKPYPSCRYTHPAVTGVLSLLGKHSLGCADIAEVRVQIGARDMRSVGGWTDADKKNKYRPEGIVDAQFSIPYTVAATLVHGRLSLAEFTDDKLRSEEILNVASRVKTILNPELDNWPLDVKPQLLEIVTHDGRSYRERIDYPKGNPKNPVTSAELVESFRSMASYSVQPLAPAQVDDAIDFILHLENARDVSAVAKLLTA